MNETNLKITYLGHATVLLDFGGHALLTDPNFSKNIFFFYKRLQKLPVDPESLPKIASILVSNAHYDHLDLSTYKYFKTETPIIAPKGLGRFLRKFLANPITEISPKGSHQQLELMIHATPVPFHGYRWLPWLNRAATAYVIQSPTKTVYFAGRTNYGKHFKEVAKKFKIDVALLPLQPLPSEKRKYPGTLSPKEILQAMDDLKANYLIPIRCGTFGFAKTDHASVLQQLRELARQRGLGERLRILQPGESF